MTIKEYLDWLIPFTENEKGIWSDLDVEYCPAHSEKEKEMMLSLYKLQGYLFKKASRNLSNQAYEREHKMNYFCIGCQPFSYNNKFYVVGSDNGQGTVTWIKEVDFETIGEYGGFTLITEKNLEEEM